MCANRIIGKDFKLSDLFDARITYAIDYYQREYAWSADDVRTLINDLVRAYANYSREPNARKRERQPPYFLGPFVYFEDNSSRRSLVDGQQRFTTLHLIFIITRRLLEGLDAKQEAEQLNRAITFYDNGKLRFRIAIDERARALTAFYEGRPFEPPLNTTLSVRNLAARAQEIQDLLAQALEADARAPFAVWLLNHVVMVGIRSPSKDNAYRIFETMNDRGARLTSVDLLKSFLLSNVGSDEDALNAGWRQMLGELTTARDDHDAPARFIKAALIAKYAGATRAVTADIGRIETALNVWVQDNRQSLGLTEDGTKFHRFVEELIGLAAKYRTFLGASRKLDQHHGLEAIYFNEVNGMAGQMVAILAAVRHEDTESVAKEKASRIANFIDRWYVLRVIEELPVQQADLEALVGRLLRPLRECHSADEVTAVLEKEIAQETPFANFRTFGYRGNNSRQVRYLLARITAYVASGLGRPNEAEAYLDSSQWQIEHIFANHAERHPGLTDPVVFRALRNLLGALVLLPARDNASIGDMTYPQKIEVYSRQNDLAAILNPGHRNRHPRLKDFAKKNGIESQFRSFSRGDGIEEITRVRQELYLRLCEQIWDPVRLLICRAFPSAETPAPEAPSERPAVPRASTAGRSRRSRPQPGAEPRPTRMLQTKFAKMVRAGILRPGETIIGEHEGRDYRARIEDDGAIKLCATGTRYAKIDDAAGEICQRSRSGMDFWHWVDASGVRIKLRNLQSASQTPQQGQAAQPQRATSGQSPGGHRQRAR